MAENYEILYKTDIDETTVWSSHDANGNLISQRLFAVKDSFTFRAICDIPCYPTGLFLHLDITGPMMIPKPSSQPGFWSITKDSIIKYYPYSGKLEVYDSLGSVDMSYYLTIEYSWGSAVPKTYCAGDKTIFSYHDFEWLKEPNDSQAKWYWSNRSSLWPWQK